MDVDEGLTTYVAQRRLRLFRTACLLCGDPHQAEDIVQTRWRGCTPRGPWRLARTTSMPMRDG